ncbi:restriction endonuclease [Peribacillus frigoritolerans]|uniref:restriction endonuclease n=1 Tax=Peribacillus frigoritolerans TaxID=450367 RepID=UPI0010594704|nr:restriction endonuclease [Peribacillus frigoritolerans]TDL82079.1 restriction endonuclease [Peribacillus frigoritolerans]
MIFIEIFMALFLLFAFFHFNLTKKNSDHRAALLAQHIDSSDEMKKTLAMGLYLRFRKETAENPPKYSTTYIKEDPLMFESFVAKVIERARGGTTWVSPASGDFGVDFEHKKEEGMFLGQVKCYQGDLSFDPIALIHSNMIKTGANGGYVITTGSFTSSARKYAEGLDVELIDGIKLVDLWIAGLENEEQEIRHVLPEYI